MNISEFFEILNDENFYNFKKMGYKYRDSFSDCLEIYRKIFGKELPLSDFDGNAVIYTETHPAINQKILKQLLKPQNKFYGIKAAEDEIIASSNIENIDFERSSVRNILNGMAPQNKSEVTILAQKQGLEFISNLTNTITEENLHKLYMMTVGDFLPEEDKLLRQNFYRHNDVFVVGADGVEHKGIAPEKLPPNMKKLIDFINADDDMNDLVKAAIIHFYLAFLHPYFDGNGRMARLLHIWFLIQKGYQSTLFIPFSTLIKGSKNKYYNAFSLVEENKSVSGCIDTTPFIIYFVNNVYNKMTSDTSEFDTLSAFENALREGKITEKQAELWKFVLSYYGTGEFSTKQLEKDYGNAAYATIRTFVQHFTELNLLSSRTYGNRTKYFIKGN